MDDAKKVQRKQILIGGGFLGCTALLLAGGMWLNDPNRGQMSAREKYEARKKEVYKNYTVDSDSLLSAEESWIVYSEKELKYLREENTSLKEKLSSIESALEEISSRESSTSSEDSSAELSTIAHVDPALSLLDTPLPELSEAEQSAELKEDNTLYASMLPPPPTQAQIKNMYPTDVDLGIKKNTNEEQSTIEYTELYVPSSKDSGNVKNINNYLPAGTFATAVLLSGVDAPTGGQAGSNPIPVLLRVKHDGQLANYASSDVSDCHVLGAAYGDIASERAYIRLEKMTCVLMNGDIIESDFNGYVSGEDGKAGFRGRVVSKNGSMIAKSLMAGVVGGLGESISQSYTNVATSALGQVQTFDPKKSLQSGIGKGASNALEKLADYYIQRANETYPIIEIDAHRIGEIVVLKGAEFGESTLIGNTHQKGQK